MKDLPSTPSQDASQLTDSSSIDSCDSRVEEASTPNHRTRGEELDDIIEQLTEAHLRTAPNDIHFYATIKERESKYKVPYLLHVHVHKLMLLMLKDKIRHINT